MKYKILLVLLYVVFGSNNILLSQESSKQLDTLNEGKINENDSTITRNFIGFVPSKADNINGWAIGYFTLSEYDVRDNELKLINGLYSNLSPLQVYSSVYVSLFSIWAIFGTDVNVSTKNNSIYGIYTGHDTTKYNQILNGVCLSIVDNGFRTKINGMEISLLSQETYQINGFSFSGLYNSKVIFKGTMLGLINMSEKGTGLQFGLINNCGDLKGVQIGLINRCGNKMLPILNFRFKKDNKS